jgi:hypothetical protein
MIPARAALSGTRGLPPFGLGGSGGSSGRMACQRSSPTRVLAGVIAYRLLGGQITDLLSTHRVSLETPYRAAGRA